MSDIRILGNDFKFIDKLGSGSFGEVYLVEDLKHRQYAVKIEEKSEHSRLNEENKIYKRLKKAGITSGIPKVYKTIDTPEYNIMLMELLGKNLDDLLTESQNKFQMGTVLKLGYDIVSLLEKIHNANLLHRDIKPNNFMIGNGKNRDKLYIMDFGLSKQYITKDNNHIAFKVDRSLVGTARYASINIHLGYEPSRRDDLEAVGYMLIYFIKGTLPWKGLKKKNSKMDQIHLIKRVKLCTTIDKLCSDLPKEFTEYIKYCRNLKFDEKPDYDYMRNLFTKMSNDLNIEMKYEWL